MTGRPDLRGAGYMRKGGPAATRAYNAAARSAAAATQPPAPLTPARPRADEARTDGRVSDRSAASRRARTAGVLGTAGWVFAASGWGTAVALVVLR